MNQATLPSRHRIYIPNSSPGGLRSSTIPLGHGGFHSDGPLRLSEIERLFFETWLTERGRNPWAPERQAGSLTTLLTPNPPPKDEIRCGRAGVNLMQITRDRKRIVLLEGSMEKLTRWCWGHQKVIQRSHGEIGGITLSCRAKGCICLMYKWADTTYCLCRTVTELWRHQAVPSASPRLTALQSHALLLHRYATRLRTLTFKSAKLYNLIFTHSVKFNILDLQCFHLAIYNTVKYEGGEFI